jgi:hypothetical protein
MKTTEIYYIKNNCIHKGDREDFNYRDFVCTPKGVMTAMFFENGEVKYWAGDQVQTVDCASPEEHALHWEKILKLEFENWAYGRGDLDFYYDLESAMERLKELEF